MDRLEPYAVTPVEPKATSASTPEKVAWIEKGSIWARVPFDRKFIADLKASMLRHERSWREDRKLWEIRLTTFNVDSLRKLGFQLSDDLEEWFRSESEESIPVIDRIDGLKGELRPFQKRGVEWIHSRDGRALIGDEMGLGKTIQALAYCQFRPDIQPVVFVVPSCAKINWAREFSKWTSLPRPQILSGRSEELIRSQYLIINYDILPHRIGQLLELNPGLVIFDEIHYLKSGSAKRTKAAVKLSKVTPRVVGLSGTPITNRPDEFYYPIWIINPRIFPSRMDYLFRFCEAHKTPFGLDTRGASNTGELHRIVSSTIMLRRKKSEVLKELPPKVYSAVNVELTNWEEYRQAESNFVEWLADRMREEKGINSQVQVSALSKLAKLRQIAAQGKMAAAVEWIRDFLDSGEKLIVFVHHVAIGESLHSQFPGSVLYNGQTPQKKRQTHVDSFQNDPSCRLFIGNIQAAGVAITLTAASNVLFIELPWTPGECDQAADRAHRIGQTAESIGVWYLLAEDTVDIRMSEALDRKRHNLSAVLDGESPEDASIIGNLLQGFALDIRNAQKR
jgi:SWI/SNF-related matrix-associated actin-dependent regulator of chromatin subfamily A-like protein 1